MANASPFFTLDPPEIRIRDEIIELQRSQIVDLKRMVILLKIVGGDHLKETDRG
jgi:hypothetical protein